MNSTTSPVFIQGHRADEPLDGDEADETARVHVRGYQRHGHR